MGCVSPLPAPSYQQSEKFTRALRRKLRPSDAALLVVPVPATPAHAFLDPTISDPVFGFGSEAGRPPKGRSRVAMGEGAERRVISVAPAWCPGAPPLPILDSPAKGAAEGSTPTRPPRRELTGGWGWVPGVPTA